MNLFNTVVYCEGDKLKVKIELIRPVENPDDNPIKAVQISIKSSNEVNLKKDGNSTKYPLFMEDEIGVTQLSRVVFKAQGVYVPSMSSEIELYYDAVIYELPLNSIYLTNFALVIDEFTQWSCPSAVLHKNVSIAQYIMNGKLDRPLSVFMDDLLCNVYATPTPKFFEATHRFIYNLFALENIPHSYQEPLRLLKSVMKRALDDYVYSWKSLGHNGINDSLVKFMVAPLDSYIVGERNQETIAQSRNGFFQPNFHLEKTPSRPGHDCRCLIT